MRTPFLCLFLPVFLNGCNNRTAQTETKDSVATAERSDTATATVNRTVEDRCFRQVIGRDTMTLRLVIRGQAVTGELAMLPYEQDQATGPIRGALANGQIRADWQRSGEGVTEVDEIVFALKGDTVTWREGERIEKQGKWVLKTPDEGYQYVMIQMDCP